MAKSNVQLDRKPKEWELLALIFACLAVIKDIPEIYRTLLIGFLNIINKYIFSLDKLYLFIKNKLLFIYKDSEFWIQIIFIFLIFIYYFTFINKIIKINNINEGADFENSKTEEILKKINKHNYIRIIKSFGFIYLREKILDFMKVCLYGTFNKKDNLWNIDENKFDYVDRILFTNNEGIEYQYSKDFCLLHIREHPKNSINFGENRSRKANFKDFKLLIIASNFFFLWIIVHAIKRIFCKCNNNKM